MVQHTTLSLGLDRYEIFAAHAACDFYTADAELHGRTPKQRLQLHVRQLRRELQSEDFVERRRNLQRQIWACLRKLRKMRAEQRIDSMQKSTRADVWEPQFFEIHGHISYDRDRWLEAAVQFGENRFGDESNSPEVQAERLELLQAGAKADRLDGRIPGSLDFWDTLQARARMRPGKAAGVDGLPSDVFLQLRFLAVAHVHRMFQERYRFEPGTPESPFWRIMLYVGIPKLKT